MATFELPNGQVITGVHSKKDCVAPCVIHSPSDHHMSNYPLLWREDRKMFERTCPCGVGHPDPDWLAYIHRTFGADKARIESIHGCCGCCNGKARRIEPEGT